MAGSTDSYGSRVAAWVKAACIAAAEDAYDRAGADGLCAEGAWEVAMDAMRGIDLEEAVRLVKEEAT